MYDNNILRSDKPSYDIPDTSVGSWLWNRLKELNGDSVCLIEENSGAELTVNELITKANSLAMALIDNGIDKSDTIVTFADNSTEHTIAFLATLLMGITLYPVSSIANVYELENLFKTLDSFVIITSKSKIDIINKILTNNENKINVKDVVVLDGVYNDYLSFDELLKEGDNKSLPMIPYFSVETKKDICLLLQSSGTSGVPKSEMLSHKAFLAIVLHFHTTQLTEDPMFAHTTPFGCISGISFLLSYVSMGVPIVIYKKLSDQSILRSIKRYKITFMYITPPFGFKLIDDKLVNDYDLSSLKHLFTGGSYFAGNVGKEIVRRYNVKLEEGYGMTEYFPITEFPNANGSEFIPGNCGTVSENTEIKIRDIDSDEILGPNIDGEICVRGPRMISGYMNNPMATREAIDCEGWLRTGDIGHYDDKKRLYITDRLKELIKYQTQAVSPTEMEQFLLTHKSVAEVAVVGVPHKIDNQWPRAYLKVKTNAVVTEDDIKQYMIDNLTEGKNLRAGVVFVDNIPRTTIGKVDRKYFKKLVSNELIE